MKKYLNTRFCDLIVAAVLSLLAFKMTYSWFTAAFQELNGKIFNPSRLNLGVILFVILWDVYHLLAAYWIVKKQRNGLLLASLIAGIIAPMFTIALFSPAFIFDNVGTDMIIILLTYFPILIYTLKRLFIDKYQK